MTYEKKILELLSQNDNIIVMTAENRAAIRNLPNIVKNNFIDVGIAEQTMIGMAAGLALRGRIPVVHALSAFLTMRAFEFIRTDIGISGLPVKLVGAVPGFLSEANGPTHQAIEDISLMRSIPGMNIFAPSDEDELVSGLDEVINSPSPFYIRFNSVQPVIKHQTDFKIGEAEIISTGDNITILTYGYMLGESIKAAEILEANGKSVGLVNLRTLKPIDKNQVKEVCKKSELVVTIEDHLLHGGLFSIVCELVVKEKLFAHIFPIALNEKWFKPALLKDVLQYEGFTGESIAQKILTEYDKIELPFVQKYF